MVRGLCIIFVLALAAKSQAQQTVTVFAAASLNGALEAAVGDFHSPVRTSYGGSGAMARQVALGAPADLVILAHSEWDDWLADKVETLAHTPALLRNRLVLISSHDADPMTSTPTASEILHHLGTGRLAMGQRDSVPAGQYARLWLEGISAWDAVQDKLAEADNVRTVLAYVSRGEAPLGIVYASDATLDENVEVIWRISETMHTPIRYTARAVTRRGVALLDHLETIEAQSRFALFGFRPGEINQ